MRRAKEDKMDEEHFNMEIRKFLKKVGVNSQREIENAVRTALDKGRLTGGETLKVEMRLQMPEVELDYSVDGNLVLA